MAYRVVITPHARRQLLKMSSDVLRRLEEAISGLGEEPRPQGARKLQGVENLFRIRVGDYRVIYQIQDKALVVLVVKIGHRGEVYGR